MFLNIATVGDFRPVIYCCDMLWVCVGYLYLAPAMTIIAPASILSPQELWGRIYLLMRTEPHKITSKVPTKPLFRRCHRCLLKMPPLYFRGAAAALRSSVVSDKEKLSSKLPKALEMNLECWGNLGCRFYTSKYVRTSKKTIQNEG